MAPDGSIGDQVSLLALPNEVLAMVLASVPLLDREPLSLTCKRMRELDLAFPKFDSIVVDWHSAWQGILVKSGKVRRKIRGRPLQMSCQQMGKIRNAAANMLTVKYDAEEPSKDVCDLISNLLKSLKYAKLRVRFDSSQECPEYFLPSLINGRHLEHAHIYLSWSVNQNKKHDVFHARELLIQLPKLDKLKINWISAKKSLILARPPSMRLLDGATLLHLIANTNEAELCDAECTAEEILDAFEHVCRSPVFKFFSFGAEKSVVDELFSTPHVKLVAKIRANTRSLHDLKRRSVIQTIPQTDYCKILMYNVDKCGNRMPPYSWIWKD